MASTEIARPNDSSVKKGHEVPAASAAPRAKKPIITPNKGTVTSLDRRMTVDKQIVDELLLVCGVIGTTTNDGNELVPVTDCLNWLQDLQRALRRDEDLFRPISLLIGKWKVVEQKLLPLVMTCRYDTAIVLTVVKILVILTKPIAANTKRAGTMIVDTSSKADAAVVKNQIKLRENALEQAELLMGYKRIVAHHPSHHSPNKKGGTGLLSIFVSLLAEPLSRSGASRTDTDHLTIELVLHLFRNLLAAEPLLRTSSDTSRRSSQLHQELLTLFEKELVLKIVLVIGQDMESRENAQYNLLMMDLLHHLLKNQDPAAVARSVLPLQERSAKSSSLLAAKLRQEQTQRKTKTHVRHGHFGGTWMTQQRGGKITYGGAAQPQKSTQRSTVAKSRNRKAEPFIGSGKSLLSHSRKAYTEDGPATHRANKSLHNFCSKFIKDCYGPVMKSLKNEFRRDSVRLEEGDKVVYFRIVWFFCQWWRLSRKERTVGKLHFTMDIFSFNLVLNSTDSFHEHKKYGRQSQAVALYSEMLQLLWDLHSSKEKEEKIMAMGLVDRLFYGSEPLDRLPKLLQRWTPGTTTREYLCNVVEVCHNTLKLLESHRHQATETLKENSENPNSKIAKMAATATDFDVHSYFCRKILSNQLVLIYTHLLGQYKVNATIVNHRVLAMFLRMARTELVAPEVNDADAPINPLGTRRVTLEPMLFNIHLFMVMEQILNDSSIQKEKEYQALIRFCNNHMQRFYTVAQDNPMAYVECLFRHVAPHRFCESFTNKYVSEELRMIAERDMLLEEQQLYRAENPDRSGDTEEDGSDLDGEEELEFADGDSDGNQEKASWSGPKTDEEQMSQAEKGGVVDSVADATDSEEDGDMVASGVDVASKRPHAKNNDLPTSNLQKRRKTEGSSLVDSSDDEVEFDDGNDHNNSGGTFLDDEDD